jgi:hypothetical protein
MIFNIELTLRFTYFPINGDHCACLEGINGDNT